MSESKEMYYMFKIADEVWKNHRPPIIHYSAVDYVHELEQQNKQLKESQTQKQIIRLCNRLDKAEQQNKQMIEALIFEYKFIKEWASAALPEKIFDELLKIKKDAIESVTGKSIDELLK